MSDATTSRSAPRDFMDQLNEAVRQNPVPAALIGAGALWLFMTSSKSNGLASASAAVLRGLGHAAEGAGSAAYTAAQSGGGAVASGAQSLGRAASELSSKAGDVASDTIGDVRKSVERAGEAATGAFDRTKDGLRRAGQGLAAVPDSQAVRKGIDALTDLFTRQPLALGAVGIAIGAAIAAAMPSSETESRVMGGAADKVRDKAQELWTETTKRAEAAASKGLEEAEAQGLTPQAVAQGLREVTDKVVGLAEKATERVSERVKGGNLPH